jgi:transcriptional regulator with XRE-family HTH domain
MSRDFTPLKSNCPVCNGARKDCRQSRSSNLIFCRYTDANPIGFKFIKEDVHGFGVWAEAKADEWSQEQREEYQRRKRERERFEQQQLSDTLSIPDRNRAIKKLHKYLGLGSKHRENLRERSLTDAQIEAGYFFSIHLNQELPPGIPANLPGVIRGKLATKVSGFACPAFDVHGRLIGWQLRVDNATDNKYRWAKGWKSSHLPNGELPLTVCRPIDGVKRPGVGLAEGLLKPFVAAQRLGQIFIGAAAANFAGSPEQFKESIDALKPETITLYPDAGAVANPHVMGQYRRTIELLSSWGYTVNVAWWGQTDKSHSDVDELTGTEAIAYISVEEFLALGAQYSGYTPSRKKHHCSGDRPISRDEWELKFGISGWLKQHLKHLKRLTNWQKTATGSSKELPQIQPARVRTLHYRPDKQLPTPEEWAGQIPPKIIFSQGQRLEVLAKLKELGWKLVCDRSFMGLGKSHDAGSLYPDPDGTNKIWYFDQNHTNPSTETVEGMTNMPPRHNGMVAVEGKVTPRGNPHLKWAKSDEVPMVNSLCHNSELFVKLKQKGYNVDVEKSTVKDDDGKARERNPICKGCRFAGKCHQEIGDGYGYLFARREAMESRRIRSSLDSAPSPGDYKYDGDTAFVEEASRCLRGTQTLSAWRQELSQLWDYVERKAPVAFATLQSIRFALADALEGKFDRIENGFNRGANHESLIASLPFPEDFANLPELLASVAQAMPKVKDLVEEPDSVTGLGGRWRSIGQLARNTFKAEAARQTQQNIEALPPNILVYALEIWAGLRPGALRVSAKQLHVTIRDARHADVLTSCEFVCLLDATGDKRQLAQMLGVASDTIIEIEQEKPNLTNLTVTNANMKGMGSKRISDACKARQKAFLEWVVTQHDDSEVRVLANLADTHLPLSGWWFNDNRSTNTFKGVGAIAAFNTPRVNLGAVQDEYLALFGNLEGCDEYYSYLIRAETIQLIGRQRAHLYPNRNFTIYLAGTNQDVSYLQEYGIRVINKEAFELCPEAGTPDQVTRWKICLAMRQLQDQGQKLTQEAIASTVGVTQGRISQIVAEFGGWKSFKKILAVLLGLYRGTNNFSSLSDEEQWLARNYLPGLLDQPPEVAIQEVGLVIRAYGVSTFLRILAASTPQTQARLLALVIAGKAFEFLILDRGGGGVGSSVRLTEPGSNLVSS